ncbi:ParM/StbA family protein [Limosilactobacillus pontis]|uniref:ParM/StbA family protein n=1 Tax=Limosilactobacillus pontis TaxID=35787 RepID=UPI0025A388EE|nr:ParM/StbA family protein [Limosilactobacillus pontis]MDM8332373.1 ParM/StbA family protein [Limosilactobacillus pontis]
MDKNKQLHFICAHDGGNGYMKDAINHERTIFPSVIVPVLNQGLINKIDEKNSTGVAKTIDDYLNHMDIKVESNGVIKNGRYLVGNVANTTSDPVESFNVNSNEGKATSDISIICLLALISYKALKNVYQGEKQLPDSINVVVDKMVTALPIEEIKIPGEQAKYANRFLHQHKVTIENFTKSVVVNIDIKAVDVQPEGVIGQYGLIGNTDEESSYRDDDIFDSLKQQYGYKEFNGETVEKIGNVISIDIGDGTIDFSVLNGASPVPRLNSSVLTGVGNVVENAVNALHQKYPMYGQINRQAFMDIAMRGDDKESKAFSAFLDNQMAIIENLIQEKTKAIYAKLNNQVGLIVVSGGGAPLVKKHYEKEFSKLIDAMSPFGAAPILWINSKHAQTLNLDGLEFRLNNM